MHARVLVMHADYQEKYMISIDAAGNLAVLSSSPSRSHDLKANIMTEPGVNDTFCVGLVPPSTALPVQLDRPQQLGTDLPVQPRRAIGGLWQR